ncbi:hypothetical protein FKW77_006120 [Venturia effusa]|uniref:AMP-dependent synthetase/ligase domain-containing protein n=1 Tax=Venturia effusa TaxID=50376 RepID=A0A517LDU9_9PEZI|nr:hypothetical protein FKW77_006120 [Venturia effusa]
MVAVKTWPDLGFTATEDYTSFLQYVRARSRYYARLWKHLPSDEVDLKKYPMVDQKSFWKANTGSANLITTEAQQDGVVFKTGGTTSDPKLSLYSESELASVGRQLALGLHLSGVQRGDRIANLFYAGELYGSFLLHVLSLSHLPAVQIPIAGHVSVESMIHCILEFSATALLGTVTTMCKIAEQLQKTKTCAPYVRLLLFSGEAMYPDQVEILKLGFPNATPRSFIYGTIDSGVIGLPAEEADQRVHKVNRPFVHVEIVSDDGEVIEETGVPGKVVVTNLERRLMPVVRYPCGDRAMWIDYQRTFRLLGRDSIGVRLGPVSIDFEHLRSAVVKGLGNHTTIAGMQVHILRSDGKDQMAIRVASEVANEAKSEQNIIKQLEKMRPMLREHVDKGMIAPCRIDFVSAQDLQVNSRTGKIVDIVDLRPTQ